MTTVVISRLAVVAAVAAFALTGPEPSVAQNFPSKTIRIIVPYTPGSPNDVVARLVAQQLQLKLSQPVVTLS